MAKPRFYGKTTAFVPNKRRDLRYCRNTYQRNRETVQRNPVAGKITKEKGSGNNGNG